MGVDRPDSGGFHPSSAAAGPPPSTDKGDAVRRVLDDCRRRRDAGEHVPDRLVIGKHPELMPELAAALAAARDVHQARLAAEAAGPGDSSSHLTVLSDAALNAPIDPEGEGGDAPHGPEVEDATDAAAPPDALPRIRGYALVAELSRGGQGVVYRAVLESTGRTVAVKVLPGGRFTGPKDRERFEREARVLATLDHPNIVTILHRGRTDDGSFYLVMPFVRGTDLGEHLLRLAERSADDPRAVLRLFATIADAVGEAHRRGVVHRDLKPGNVRVDERGTPYVLDFGLARPAGGMDWGGRGGRAVTAEGHVVGSLPWASPEQADGRLDLDARTDVYSLGVMLYHALTGRFPYDVSGPTRTVLANIHAALPDPPSRAGGRYADCLAPDVDAVVLRALAKLPADRHDSAAELARDLAALADARLAPSTPAAVPATAAVAPPAQPARQWLSRRRRVLVPILAVVLASIGGTVWYGLAHRHPVGAHRLPSVENSVGMRLIRIPGGEFLTGSPVFEGGRDPSEEQRRVSVAPFYLSATEVTRGQYRAVMGWDPAGGDVDGPADLPASGMTWAEAVAFCQRLGDRERRAYRLPTEAEWEYACRAGDTGPYGESKQLGDVGWYAANSGGRLHPVGALRPNGWGLSDMLGGVEEWCADAYPGQGGGTAVFRVVRGGSVESPAAECRAAARVGRRADAVWPHVGFRVALGIEPGGDGLVR